MNLQFKRFFFPSLVILLIPALLIFINPYSAHDLNFYYWLSPDRSPPDKIIIVALNEENIPDPDNIKSIHSWPRNTHAKLIEKLNQAGASSIVFDVFFNKKTPVDDLFAQAIANSGKTFLVNKVEQNWQQDDEAQVLARYQRIVQPLPMFSNSAVLTAPSVYAPDNHGFYYQYNPVLNLLDQKLPQLPVLLVCWELVVDGVMDKYLQTLKDNITGQSGQFTKFTNMPLSNESVDFFLEFSKQAKSRTELFKHGVKLTPGLTEEQINKLEGLVNVAISSQKWTLNFLGKLAQYITLDYAEVLAGQHQAILNKATIFVGLSSDFKQTQIDSFLTPASFDGKGQHGVFLLATAYDNISHNNSIQKLNDWQLYFLLACIIFLILPVFFIRHYFYQLLFGFFVISIYVVASLLILAKTQIWLPLLVPIGVFLILWMRAMYNNLRKTHYAKQRVSDILTGYLPQMAIDKLLKSHDNKIMGNNWGVCLVTDVRGFTALSEQQTPDKVHEHLNRYYKSLINTINQHQGIVSDLVGDMMMALWIDKKPNSNLKKEAVTAAFKIVEQVKRYNLGHPEFQLNTGIGIHVGDISLGSLGSETHFEYRPIGDVINTTSRIESLNKIFNLPILVSAEFADGISHGDFTARFIADVMLSGKKVPTKLHSLEKNNQNLLNLFSKALSCLKEFDLKQATVLFKNCLDNHADEASKLYLWLLAKGYINEKFCGLLLADWLDDYNRAGKR